MVKDYTLDVWEYWAVVFVLFCLFIFIDVEIYLYFCAPSSTEGTDQDDKEEETIELAPTSELTVDDDNTNQHTEDIESKGYGSTDISPVAAGGTETPSEPQNWTSYLSNIVPTFTGGWTGIEKEEVTTSHEDHELGSSQQTDESNLPELQSFIKPQYISSEQTKDSSNNDGKQNDDNNDRSGSSSPSKNRRGSVTTPEEKARRSKHYAAAYDELQQLFRTKTRVFFKALHPPGLKVRGSKELSSPEVKVLSLGAVFEVKDLGLTKRGEYILI